MTAFAHRFDFQQFRSAFAPRKPRSTWLRVLLGWVGVAMLAVGLVYRLMRQRGRPIAGPARNARIVDGEFRVVGKTALPSA